MARKQQWQEVGSGEGGELVSEGSASAEARYDDRELTPCDEGGAGAKAPARTDTERPPCHSSRDQLAGACDDGERSCRGQDVDEGVRSDLEGEEQEERGREEVAEGFDQGPSPLLCGSGLGKADQEGADGSGYLDLLGQPAHEEREAEHGKQKGFGGTRREKSTEALSPPEGRW